MEDVGKDGNCGYRALSLQLYNNEDNYNIVRTHVYNYLVLNYKTYKNEYTFFNNDLILGQEYIPNIIKNQFWMGDMELSVIHIIYDCLLYIYEIEHNKILKLININGDKTDKSKFIINLCYINDNHFAVLYEKTRTVNIKSILSYNDLTYVNKIIKNQREKINISKKSIINNNFIYANDDRKYKYNDIIKYLNFEKNTNQLKYPAYIYKIDNRNKKKNQKKNFLRAVNYTLLEIIYRLKW